MILSGKSSAAWWVFLVPFSCFCAHTAEHSQVILSGWIFCCVDSPSEYNIGQNGFEWLLNYLSREMLFYVFRCLFFRLIFLITILTRKFQRIYRMLVICCLFLQSSSILNTNEMNANENGIVHLWYRRKEDAHMRNKAHLQMTSIIFNYVN